MGLIDEVKAFDELLEYTELSPQAIALWYAVLNRFNRAGWRSPISIANSTLCTKTGLSVAGLKRVRNTLVQIGLISYKPSTSNKAPLYTFVPVAQCEPHGAPHTEPLTEPHTEPVTVPHGEPQTEPHTEPITRLRLRLDKDEDIKESKQKKSAWRFVKPSVDEIRAYCEERNNGVDAERFFDYYEANGWKVGKSPMKDWKAAVRTWERNNYSKPQARKETMQERAERLERELGHDNHTSSLDTEHGIPF